MKDPKKILTNRSARISRSKATLNKANRNIDNDGDILGRVQATIDTAQHGGTLGDDPEEELAELNEQALKEQIKQQKIHDKELEEAIINSTQKQGDAVARTISEIMDGPIIEKPIKTKEGKK
jgi:hypothetical protein